MKMKGIATAVMTVAVLGFGIQPAMAEVNTTKIFKKRCALCHSLKKRKFGPPFIHMNTDPKVLKTTITNGRKSMPKFGSKLSSAEIDAMVSYIRSIHVK